MTKEDVLNLTMKYVSKIEKEKNRAKAGESRLSSQMRALNNRDEQNSQKLEDMEVKLDDVEVKLRAAEKKVVMSEIAMKNVSKEAKLEVENEMVLAKILFEDSKRK
jgi:hypothetical protein